MKKVVSVLLVAMLLISAMAVTVFAAEPGETVNISFTVSNNPGFSDIAAEIMYNDEVLELTALSAGSLTSAGMPMPNVEGKMFGWMNFADATGSGTLCVATFKIKADAPAGTYPVTAAITSCYNAAGNAVSLSVSGGTVTVDCAHKEWDPADCENPKTCKACGATEGNALGHDYGSWTELNDTQHKRTCYNDPTHIEYADHTGGTATCVAKAKCDVCKAEYGSFNAANHVGGTKLVGKVDATCSKDGYTGDTHCNSCNVKIKDGDPITATGAHKDADGKWESNGNNHWHTCSCTAKFDEAAHAGGTATCIAKAKCATCGKDHGALNPQKHTGGTEIRDAVTATCSKDGYTGDTYCKSCNVMIEKGEVIKANGEHVYINWTKVDEKGHKGTCGCGATKTEAHKWNDGVITTQPTCKNDGVKTFTCSDCKGTKTEVIKATGEHVYTNWTKVDDNKHEGTCGCGTKTTADHKWDAGKVTTDATCGKDGVKTFACSVCKGTKTEAIKATGKHDYTKSYKDNGDGTHSALCACGAAEAEKHDFSVEGPITVKPSTSNAGKQDILCVCGAKTVKTLPQLPADLDDVPKTGDVTIQITMGVAAMISMAAAAAFVFKRKIAK